MALRRRTVPAQSRDGPPEIPKPVKIPTLTELTAGRKTLNAVLQRVGTHPAFVWPIAAGTIAGGACVFVALTPVTLGVAICGVGGGALAAAYNFIYRKDEFADEFREKCRKEIEELRAHEFDYVEQYAEHVGFRKGAKEAKEVTTAYKGLIELLNRPGLTMDFGVIEWRDKARDAYREAMGSLVRAISLYETLSQIDGEALRTDLENRRQELGQTRKGSARDSLQALIDDLEKRLERYTEGVTMMNRLLTSANSLETALTNAKIDCAEMRKPESVISDGQAATRLEAAFTAARQVSQELEELVPAEVHDDRRYS